LSFHLDFLYTAISWVLLRWHDLWALAFGKDADISWVLSIIFLVITIRLILFPLFVKQIHSQRKMQELQPKLKALQTKHKGDKETLQREMMALYKENGANPVAGCLPIFLQAPVFLSLYHVLKRLDPTKDRNEAAKTLYSWTAHEFDSATRAKIFGAPISAHLSSSAQSLEKLGASATTVKIVAVVLIAIMVVTTYITQRQLMAKQAATGTAADPQQQMIQRVMLYGIPASLLVSGSLFPLGVVLYWCTTNVWSMGQQFYVLKRMPQPGAPAVAPSAAVADARAVAPRPGAKPTKPTARPVSKPPAVTRTVTEPVTEPAVTPSADGQGSHSHGSSAMQPVVTPKAAPTKSGTRPPTNRAKNRRGGRR